jgi:NAD(P)-dependent dehydrogenase (short-subunit alcohol dehydrogenase family)
LGIADALAQAGADVVVWGTNARKNAEAEKRLSAHGRRVVSRRVDVSDEAAIVEGMKAAAAELGRIDAVFANAGIGLDARSFMEISLEDFRRIEAINIEGVFLTMREAAKHMVERARTGDAGGSLVAIASVAAIEGAARNEHYGASKGAVLSMIRGIAVEFARYGIRANSIAPGWIATEMTSGAQQSANFTEKVIARVPMRRWGRPDEFGGIAVYLASEASSYHTGDEFIIDGGYTKF